MLEDLLKNEALLWGLASITVISLLSMTGLIFLPLIRSKARGRCMQFFLALAVSTLCSDAFLHILPRVVGVHSHTPHGGEDNVHQDHHHHHHHDHDHHNLSDPSNHTDGHTHHDHSDQIHDILFKMSIVLAAIYALYLFESLTKLPALCGKLAHVHDGCTIEKAPVHSHDGWSESETGAQCESQKGLSDDPKVCCGMNSVSMTIILGDAIHNFIDGVAVGASFATSNRFGFATSLAVICHEIPHELGDFAVLIESGLSISRAVILNLLSSFTAYIGLFVGLAALNVKSAEEVLLALTAGMFLYVAWLDMLVHLKHEVSKDRQWLVAFVLQNMGFLLGFGIMFAIGWFEPKLIDA